MKKTIKKIVNSNKITRQTKDLIKNIPYYHADEKHYRKAKDYHESED